jgi:hypothetical protein
MLRVVILAVTVVVAIASAGCGGGSTVGRIARSVSVDCDSLSPEPITEQELVATLAKQDIYLYPDPIYTDCTDYAGRTLQNLPNEGPHANPDQHDEIEAREGHVFCSANPGPPAEKNLHHPREFTIREDKTEFVFANVDCEVYTTNGNREAALSLMRAAMTALGGDVKRF